MSGLTHVTLVRLPKELLLRGHEMLREAGARGVEGLVLWAGTAQDHVFSVQAVLRPAQHCTRCENGLLVIVDGPELHRIGVWLFQHGMQLLAQIHSHPQDAYHSTADDAIPIVTTEGGLSLVVPEFASGDADISSYAIYRLDGRGIWNEMPPAVVSQLIDVVDE